MHERGLTTEANPQEHATAVFAKRVVDQLPKDRSWLKERELERYFNKRA